MINRGKKPAYLLDKKNFSQDRITEEKNRAIFLTYRKPSIKNLQIQKDDLKK